MSEWQAGPTDTGLTAIGISAARARVLARLRSRTQPWAVQELADELALHRNTIREHLTALAGDGLAEFVEIRSSRPGRPARHYTATTLGVGIDYPELVAVLSQAMAELPDAERSARSAGEGWGRRLAAELETRHSAIDLLDALAVLGFSPCPLSGSSFELRTCPVLAAARRNPQVVCQVHAGVIKALAEPRLGPVQVEVRPLASPAGCLVHLRQEPAA